jgi:hypothetical protein
MPFSKFLGTQSPQMSQQAATTTTKIALPTAAALLLPDLTSYSQPLSASPNKNNATTTTADAAAADAAPVDSDEPTLEISPVVERSPERPANKRSTRGGGGGSTPTRRRDAPKRAAAAMSKKVVDDDDDGAYDDSDIDAPKKSRKRAPVKKRAAADDSSPRRGRPTRLEQDEDPNRQRVPHALSFGTLEAPPVVDVGEAEKQLQALASTVDARQQQLVAWGADSSATDAQIEAAMSACSSELRDVRRICCASELSMPLMALFLRLEQALVNQHVILEVVLGGDAKHALLITKQPHMRVPFKSKPDQVGTIEVELFSSPREANVRYQIDGASESTAKDWLEKHLKNASKALDVNGSARFDSLMFDESTRMEFVTMQFRAKAPGRSAIESGVSNPMVVVTNESQWPGAARKLLWQHTFGDVESIPWPLFANYLSLLVVVSIYGGIETMVRALTPWELRFLHRRWFKSTRVIGRETAIAFWTYFGPVLTALRFKRHIANDVGEGRAARLHDQGGDGGTVARPGHGHLLPALLRVGAGRVRRRLRDQRRGRPDQALSGEADRPGPQSHAARLSARQERVSHHADARRRSTIRTRRSRRRKTRCSSGTTRRPKEQRCTTVASSRWLCERVIQAVEAIAEQ